MDDSSLQKPEPWILPKENVQGRDLDFFLKKIKGGVHLPLSLYKGLKNLSPENLLFPFSLEHSHISYDKDKNSAQIDFFSRGVCQGQWQVENSCLYGKHNIFNLAAASIMAQFMGMESGDILKQWEKNTTKYENLPHRLEIIGAENQGFVDDKNRKKRLTVVNDSKATNVESTLVALQAFQKPILLLLGGEPKGDSYLPIIQQKINLKIYPFGKAAPLICEEIGPYPSFLRESSSHLLDAAKRALLDAQDGDLILLSPACASFDEFKNYEERGQVFRRWALSCFEETEFESERKK